MTLAKSDDPKKLLRCPGGCGNAAVFTALVKCARCGKGLCGECAKRFRQRPHCKTCFKARQREESRKSQERSSR